MKYAVILCDGMADRPLEQWNGKTPMEAADTPNMNRVAKRGRVGRMRTLYDDLPTGSDVANLSVLGYDPHKYYTGRSPIEALGLGIELCDTDMVFRMNFVTLSDNEPFCSKIMIDNSAGKISTEEADELVRALTAELGTDAMRFFTGVTYRHVFILSDPNYRGDLTPPHDILEKRIGDYLPKGDYAADFLRMMDRSYTILSEHPVNKARVAKGLRPANCLWLWGAGRKPAYETFESKTGLKKARMITAVPLLQGLAAGMKMDCPAIPGATGEYDTNYAGKATSAIDALRSGYDFVFIHIEAPDECGHDGDAELKKKSIEQIDRHIVGPVYDALDALGEPYQLLITPDHATPICARTHTAEPIPFLLLDSRKTYGGRPFSEAAAKDTDFVIDDAYTLMGRLLEK